MQASQDPTDQTTWQIRKLTRLLGPAVAIGLIGFTLWVLHRELGHLHWRQIVASVRALPGIRLASAIALTMAGYTVLTGYDLLGMRYLKRRVPVLKVMFASFLSYVFSNNVGLSVIGASAVRLRVYTSWGVSPGDVGRLIAFTTTTFWLGILTLAGVVFLVGSIEFPSNWPLPTFAPRILGSAFIILIFAYLLMGFFRVRPMRLGKFELPIPTWWQAVLQLLIGMADWMLAALTLFVLLPAGQGLSLGTFLGMYLLAQVVGLVSQVPGGVGVFESLFLIMVKPFVPAETAVGSLLAYRAIYYLLPLVVGALAMGAFELQQQRATLSRVAELYAKTIGSLVPYVVALSAFLGGVVLIISGSVPAVHGRMKWLVDLFPLGAIELSHLLGSAVGMALLVLARALHRRLDAAYWLAVAMYTIGILASLLKGFDYEEAIVLTILLVALLPCRRSFYRKASLVHEALTWRWFGAILVVLVAAISIGLLSHRHVEHSSQLWWRFRPEADAPRFLRGTLAAIVVLLTFGVGRLLRPAAVRPETPTASELAEAGKLAASSSATSANLVWMGDKALMFSDRRDAFIMYAVQGSSWIAMGDPVGPVSAWPELAWRYRESADRAGDRPVFYQVQPDHLDIYVDMGLALLKLGEEGRVPLNGFSLEGGARKDLRKEMRHTELEGLSFEVAPAQGIASLLPRLKDISDDWLASRNMQEKGFSLGSFDMAYVSRFPAAVVRRGSRTVAFANLWLCDNKEEMAPDLMRYSVDAPRGVMTYLFVQLMCWGAAHGYRWFNLGMAPLAGMPDRVLARLWNRAGAWLFRHGSHFYHFEGLRQFKDKFDPIWTPKYLASPGGLALPVVLSDLVTLISRGQATTSAGW